MLRLLAEASLVFYEPPFFSQNQHTERIAMSCTRWFEGLCAVNTRTNLEEVLDPSPVNNGGAV
jgi:hypothetical protein